MFVRSIQPRLIVFALLMLQSLSTSVPAAAPSPLASKRANGPWTHEPCDDVAMMSDYENPLR